MAAIVLSLCAAASWGLADFFAGLKSRRVGVLPVLLWVEATGLVVVAAIIVATGEPLPDTRTLVTALIAGVAGTSALGAFYRALSIGTMSIVAPISATGVVLPVIVGIATGDTLQAVVAVGLAVTVCGVLLASREEVDELEHGGPNRPAILLALVTALGFGLYFTFADIAADGSILWLLALGRIVSLPAIAIARPPRPRSRWCRPARDRWQLMAIGCADLAATAPLRRGDDARRAEHRVGDRRAVPRRHRPARPRAAEGAHQPAAGGRRRARAGRRRARQRRRMTAVLAHLGGPVLAPTQVAVPLLLAVALRPPRAHARRGRRGRSPGWRQACFMGGIAIIVVTITSPIGHVADELFWVHMAEHLLIADIAALLIVLGLTGPLLAPALQIRWLGWLRVLTNPAVALPLWAADLFVWHLPALYQGAVEHAGLHALEHAMFIGFGVAIVDGAARPAAAAACGSATSPSCSTSSPCACSARSSPTCCCGRRSSTRATRRASGSGASTRRPTRRSAPG